MSDNRRLPLLFFGGYSGSGKTTHCIPILRSFGYRILSSSVLMHQFSDRLIEQVFGCDFYDSYNRELELSVDTQLVVRHGSFFGLTNISKGKYRAKSRQFLIDLAEKTLVPVFTRAVFAHAIADIILQNPDVCYAVEIFKAEEFAYLQTRLNLFKDHLLEAGRSSWGDPKTAPASLLEDHVVFNLRRQTENPFVDSRSLIPGAINVDNNGSYAELEHNLRVLAYLAEV